MILLYYFVTFLAEVNYRISHNIFLLKFYGKKIHFHKIFVAFFCFSRILNVNLLHHFFSPHRMNSFCEKNSFLGNVRLFLNNFLVFSFSNTSFETFHLPAWLVVDRMSFFLRAAPDSGMRSEINLE